MSAEQPSPAPTAPSDRIVSLDVLRGVALLGILLVNIWVFAMPEAVLLNPTVYGDFTGWNYFSWLVTHIFVEQKMISLFTMLFGAGVLLFTTGKERAVRLFQRRNAWLLIIGLAHAYLLWYGDILVAYALCGLLVVYLRHWPPLRLFLLGIGFIGIISVSEVLVALTAGADIIREQWEPATAALQSEVQTYRSGWVEQTEHRVPTAFTRQTSGFINYSAWRVGGLMCIGMALYKSGFLTNDRSTKTYLALAIGGSAIGILTTSIGVWYIAAMQWQAEYALLWRQFNYWGSLALAGGYIGIVMLWCRLWATGVVSQSLAAVGRLALTNYLLQSVLATFVFYGHGLGLFGQVSRIEMVGVVLAIWAIQIPVSVLWLRYFRYGPIEWIWRSLTYGQRP